MLHRVMLLGYLFLIVACGDNQDVAQTKYIQKKEVKKDKTDQNQMLSKEKSNSMRMLYHEQDTLVPVDFYNKNIFWELKYATKDNFMHRVLYDTLDKPYVQIAIARRLAKCQEYLSEKHSKLHLLVYDALRPLSVQWEMWNALDTIPAVERGKFVSNPVHGSVHNYAAAIDLTICDQERNPLDMGAGYDDIRLIAYPSLEAQFLENGELSSQQVDNRRLLRKTMRSQYFSSIPTEWWHFNAFSRAVAKGKYAVISNELF